MRKALLRLLECPHCHSGLAMKIFSQSTNGFEKQLEEKARVYCKKNKLDFNDFKTEVEEGVLECRCKRWFPIINKIPRMLSDELFDDSILIHSDFLKKYESKLPKEMREETVKEGTEMQKKTRDSFGFQWLRFREMVPEFKQNFLDYIFPLDKKFFEDKLVMDAGCGFGRHTYYCAEFGSEVVGMDLSEAVSAARENCDRFPLCHIVQADIYYPPFRRCFDFVFSIGVLHHLPNPESGFASLTRYVKTGGEVFAWVYGKEGREFKTKVMEKMHDFTRNMNHELLYAFCIIPAVTYHTSNKLCEGFNRIRLKPIANIMPFKNYSRFPFRVKHADSFDFLSTAVNNYYTKEEFRGWFERAKLKDIKVTSLKGRSWRGIGRVGG